MSTEGAITRTSPPKVEAGESAVRDARYHDVARRLLAGSTPKEICEAHGFSRRCLRDTLNNPRFLEIYERAREGLYERLDETIKDEKAAPMLRRTALTTRSLTLLAEVMEGVREHIESGKAGNPLKATMLKVGVEAVAEVRQLNMEASRGGGGAAAGVRVNVLQVAPDAATNIRAAFAESGVDLSDVIDIAPYLDRPSLPTHDDLPLDDVITNPSKDRESKESPKWSPSQPPTGSNASTPTTTPSQSAHPPSSPSPPPSATPPPKPSSS